MLVTTHLIYTCKKNHSHRSPYIKSHVITKEIFRFICIDFYLFPKANGLTLLKPSKRLLLATAFVQIRGGEEKAEAKSE